MTREPSPRRSDYAASLALVVLGICTCLKLAPAAFHGPPSLASASSPPLARAVVALGRERPDAAPPARHVMAPGRDGRDATPPPAPSSRVARGAASAPASSRGLPSGPRGAE